MMRTLTCHDLGALPPLAQGERIELRWLPVARLVIDDRYQREVGAQGRKHVRNIAARFEWRKFSPVIVTPVEDDHYAIIDGQHRSMAALARGMPEVPCAIVAVSTKEAAAVFAAVNGEQRRIHGQQVYKACLAAGEDWALKVKAACDAAGVVALPYPVPANKQKPFQTNGVGRLKRIVERHGVAVLEAVLRIVKAKPHSHVPGFIHSARIDEGLQSLQAQPGHERDPLAVAAKMVEGLRRSVGAQPVVQQVAASMAVNTQAVASDDLRARVQDLKERGFTKSMVAASLRIRHALVLELWGAG